jgi:hypothetical protein
MAEIALQTAQRSADRNPRIAALVVISLESLPLVVDLLLEDEE